VITINFKILDLQPGCRILDIGCGSGRHTAAAHGLEMAFVVGADPSIKDLKQAKERLEFHQQLGVQGQGSWHLAAADVTALPFKDRRFDLVICSEVLEHIANHRQAIREVVRVLRPGGHLAVSIPRRWPEAICWALSAAYRRTQGGHLRIYATNSLILLIRQHGLNHWHTHFAHGLHSPYWWLKCLLGIHRDQLWPVKLFHRFLVWDMLAKPRLTRLLDRWLNPLCGKSVVLYFRKNRSSSSNH
jgi:2-polyprenyl-3-methyl-5-hydroxy-6-metoxy-1,4-benzoquinol methylase